MPIGTSGFWVQQPSVDQGTIANTSLKVEVVISDTTLAASAASIDVQNIPTGYKYFKIQLMVKNTTGGDLVICRCNNDSGNNYDSGYLYAQGIAPVTSIAKATNSMWLGWHGNTDFGIVWATINNTGAFNKAGTGISYKNDGTNPLMMLAGGQWLNTTEINRITVLANANQFLTGTRLVLTGVK